MRNENRALVNRRSLLALLMILAGVIALTILATVVGWFSTYMVPLAVLLVAAVVVLWLLVQLAKKLPEGTTSRIGGNKRSRSVHSARLRVTRRILLRRSA
jgi:CHASE2 domain-containing sensor protein